MAMSNGVNIPEEIMTEILLRLPAKSLGRFKCVSNPWRTLISNPKFIKSHLLNRYNHHEPVILAYRLPEPRDSVVPSAIYAPPPSLYAVDLDDQPFDDNNNNNDDKVATDVNFENSDRPALIFASCDGLLLLFNEYGTTSLVNPTTRESKKLPVGIDQCWYGLGYDSFGLGYDSFSDDYKVVHLSFDHPATKLEPGCSSLVVSVYSTKKDCWRRFRNSPYCPVEVSPPSIFLHGSFHWLALSTVSDRSLVIAAFDLANETFRELPLPPSSVTITNGISITKSFRFVQGFRSMIVCSGTTELDIWVMKEYGVRESWTKITISELDVSSFRPICLSTHGDVLLRVVNENKIAMYNVKDGAVKDIVIHGIPSRFEPWGTFVQSLVSPNCNNVIEEQNSAMG